MAKSKNPGARVHPDVRAFILTLFDDGWPPSRVFEELQRLQALWRGDGRKSPGDDAVLARFPVTIRSEDFNVSETVVYEMHRARKKTVTASAHLTAQATLRASGTVERRSPWHSRWRWWEHPSLAKAIFPALAALERDWLPMRTALSQEEAEAMAMFLDLAPDLPPQFALSLAHWFVMWTRLPEEERLGRLWTVGEFLRFRPWQSTGALLQYHTFAKLSGLDYIDVNEATGTLWYVRNEQPFIEATNTLVQRIRPDEAAFTLLATILGGR
jgi:hypothetical protein